MFLVSTALPVHRADALPPSASRLSRLDNAGSSTSHSPIGLHGLLWGICLFLVCEIGPHGVGCYNVMRQMSDKER
jgi:hypothetical protein